jgi:thiamine-monophosphate kinase
MRELRIVKSIRKLAESGAHDRSLILGIGDDCAVLRPRKDEDLVFTTDFVLEDRHFTRATHSAADIGHQALARSLSDLAAMGSEPVFCLVSLAVPAELSGRWLKSFYKGLLALAGKHRVSLAGGDLARFDKVVAEVMCCGRVPRGKAILRGNAKPGDAIYVTGALGAAARGLRRRAEPRITEGIRLRRAGVGAAIDISDGLAIDLHRLCLESKIAAEIDRVPIARGASLDDALYGGEDYELLFTAPTKKKIPVSATRIGAIRSGTPGELRFQGKRIRPKGFDHFNETSR